MKLATARRKARLARQDRARVDAYYLGGDAWHAGVALDANPFLVESEDFHDWHQGWLEEGAYFNRNLETSL